MTSGAPATLACTAGQSLPTEAASLDCSASRPPSNQPSVCSASQVVGVDLEWRPSFGAGGRPFGFRHAGGRWGRVFLGVGLAPARISILREGRHTPPSPSWCLGCSQIPPSPSWVSSTAPPQALRDLGLASLGPRHMHPPTAGYGMAGDLRSLGAPYLCPGAAGQQLQGCLDLLQVHRQVSTGCVLGPPCSGRSCPHSGARQRSH